MPPPPPSHTHTHTYFTKLLRQTGRLGISLYLIYSCSWIILFRVEPLWWFTRCIYLYGYPWLFLFIIWFEISVSMVGFEWSSCLNIIGIVCTPHSSTVVIVTQIWFLLWYIYVPWHGHRYLVSMFPTPIVRFSLAWMRSSNMGLIFGPRFKILKTSAVLFWNKVELLYLHKILICTLTFAYVH